MQAKSTTRADNNKPTQTFPASKTYFCKSDSRNMEVQELSGAQPSLLAERE